MVIGIDGSRAFIKRRTGIEEYSYQVIKNLRHWLSDDEVVLYIRHDQAVDFDLPENWKVRKLRFPKFWTQIRLSLEMLLHPIDLLFVPAHTVPVIHPARNTTLLFNNFFIWYIRKIFNTKKDWEYAYSVVGGPKKTIVAIHGLEYEFCPEAYSFWERAYMRFVIKNSCKWASRVICVSENTKNDLIDKYFIEEKKINVVYEGYSGRNDIVSENKILGYARKENCDIRLPFIIFIGRIEKRKNVSGIVEAFDILKEKYGLPHKLVLVGKPGYGYEEIKNRIVISKFKKDIVETGYVEDQEKWELLKCADVFVFPTFYEGFGLPILEAQNALVPVVTSKNSSIPEVADGAVLYADPDNHQEIAENIRILIDNPSAKEDMVRRGFENLKRFSWADCAKKIAVLLKD